MIEKINTRKKVIYVLYNILVTLQSKQEGEVVTNRIPETWTKISKVLNKNSPKMGSRLHSKFKLVAKAEQS